MPLRRLASPCWRSASNRKARSAAVSHPSTSRSASLPPAARRTSSSSAARPWGDRAEVPRAPGAW